MVDQARSVEQLKAIAARSVVKRQSFIQSIRAQTAPLIAIALIILFWETFNWIFDQPEWILPPLHKIIYTAIEGATDRFLYAAYVTLVEVIGGFFLGVIVGLTLGAILFHSNTLRKALYPLIIYSQTIPVIAIAPVFVIWFGFGPEPKIMLAALIIFFPVFMTTFAGLSSIEREMTFLMESLGASGWETFKKVRLPGALPFVFTGLKQAAILSPIGAIVGEFVGSHEGLGPVMIASNAAFKTHYVFAGIFYLAIMAVALFFIVVVVERLVIPWHFVRTESTTK
ncbi:MAG: ABC transporter permease [Alphaproteobacteria bacterium]|nr:ABC transporter permease [Alphaproteobacteria bacterium]